MTADQRYVLGIAFKAGRNDLVKRGADGKRDIASADVIEQAAWNFMKGSRDIGVEHADGTVGHATVVESYIHRGDPTTFPLDDGDSVTVDPGDWVIGAILDDPAWNLYKAGKITGWSPQGTARRRPIRSNP